MNLEQLKENMENELTTYENFVKLVNKTEGLDISEFFELMNDNLAEQIIIDDFNILTDYTSKIKDNFLDFINNPWNTSEYTYQPSEDGGIYTDSFLVHPDLGILGDYMSIDCVAQLQIDFRPSCSTYISMYIMESKKSLLGEYGYLHYEVNSDGDIFSPSLESM